MIHAEVHTSTIKSKYIDNYITNVDGASDLGLVSTLF